ncbi:hypothetical protein MACJ_003464 [Theileria orientalis]|uniref:Uncharacterized protein n=1 Tax=Theileria orientalis TaxID=68886 RepID=A0A976SK73_THEOR|nr:hypothetical protein MACJ_003464 [Theileria orientalis]
MPRFRRDQIPFMPSCFINFVWAFTSFLSVDMIKLYSYQFMHEVNYPGLFYGVFAISFILLIFLKFNRVFTTVMVIWFNLAVHLMFIIFIYFPVRNRIFFMIIFGIWSHLYAMNLISTVYLASYNLGGLHGLIMGTTMSYYLGYFLQHSVDHPSDFSIASRRSTCNWFIAIRFITSVIAFKFYRDYLEFFFYFEYNDSVKRTSMTDMFKWVDGRAVEIMSSVRITELMPSSIDYACIKHLFTNDENSKVYLILIYFSYLSSSFFSPLLSPTPLVLSMFVRNEVYFVEFLGGLVGIITAILLRRYIDKLVLVVYGIHVFLGFASYFGFNTPLFNMYKHKNVLYALSFLASSLGTFVLVYSFINFISISFIVSCSNKEKKPKPLQECVVCCKNDTGTCLCYNKNNNETCSHMKDEATQENRLTCANIWVPWNNHSTYRDWTYSDCQFCLSQNYNNTKATCKCNPGSGTGENKIHCCACACSMCGEDKECNCTCNGSGECKDTCCCKKNKGVVNYLLRNCVVSCCPYCDMCLVLECVKIGCVCACSHKNHQPRNSIEHTAEGEEISLTKIRVRMDFNQRRHLFLCTYTDVPSEDLQLMPKQFCCCDDDKCKGQQCCIKCCKMCKKKGESCGKHFNIADYKASSCCHYDLKLWMSMKEMNTMFHIGQKPFKDKYKQINSLVFSNESCRNCCKGSGCCTKKDPPVPNCSECRSADVVKLIEDSNLSQSGGAVKLKCTSESNTADPKCCCCCCCCSGGGMGEGDANGGNAGVGAGGTSGGGAVKKKDCNCSCSSRRSPTCSCTEKKCRAVKVLPTNLPYQFRKVDIMRNEVISLLGFAVVLFCLIKLIVALGFSLINQRDSLKLNFVVGDFTSVNGTTIRTFQMPEYMSDKAYALERIENYNGPDEFLINYAIDLEVKDLEDRTRGIKEMMDELNALKFDRWLEDIIKTPFDIMPVEYTKLRFYKHLNGYIDHALANQAFKMADRIFVYFDRFPRRWEIEWSDFERRFLQNLKVYTSYSLSLNSVGYFDTNTEFQRQINNRQSLILSHLNSKNDNLTMYLMKNRELLEKYRRASPHRKLPKYIDLWEYRTNLIKGWAADKTLFLNWSPFVVSMDRIMLWNKLYRAFYIRAFKERYDEGDSIHR